jgi:hypothetical protein
VAIIPINKNIIVEETLKLEITSLANRYLARDLSQKRPDININILYIKIGVCEKNSIFEKCYTIIIITLVLIISYMRIS